VNTNNEPNKVIDETEKAYKEDFSKVYDKAVAKLRKTTETDYDKVYERTIKRLAKLCNYPEFSLKPIGYNYNWQTGEVTIVPVSAKVMEREKDKILKDICAKYDAYFRKVNFLYKYFEGNGSMVDEWYAPVTTADLEDIIERCDRILKDKDEETAHAELPTQSGFFFGSTDYDDWYFHDVKDCKKQLKRFLKLMQKNGDNAYIIFSW
jgi:hypothetical protein